MPIIVKFKTTRANEATIKYFLIQIPPGLIFLGGVIRPVSVQPIIFLTLLLKLGAFPFFIWPPHIFSGISFPIIFLLSTFQKIPPLLTLAFLNFPSTSVVIFTVLIGAIGGLFITNIKKILAFSSISHTGWLIAIAFFPKILGVYIFLYGGLLGTLLNQLTLAQIKRVSQVPKTLSTTSTFTLWVLIISLAGLPPLAGFSLKWLRLSILATQIGIILLPLRAIFAISLYFYLQIIISRAIFTNSPRLRPSPPPIFPLFFNIIFFPFFLLIAFN